MKLGEFLKKWDLNKISLNTKFVNAELSFEDKDKEAAWELYIELLTRITTQPLPNECGDEETALESIYSLFKTTREILKSKGPKSIGFAKIAIPVLNQIVRPFTAKWHKKSLAGAFEKQEECKKFRHELEPLQKDLRNYTRLLCAMAEVEDITDLEI